MSIITKKKFDYYPTPSKVVKQAEQVEDNKYIINNMQRFLSKGFLTKEESAFMKENIDKLTKVSSFEYAIRKYDNEIESLQNKIKENSMMLGVYTIDSSMRNINNLTYEMSQLNPCLMKNRYNERYIEEEQLDIRKKRIELVKSILGEWQSMVRLHTINVLEDWIIKNKIRKYQVYYVISEKYKIICKDEDVGKLWEEYEKRKIILNLFDKRCNLSRCKILDCNRIIGCGCNDLNTVEQIYEKYYGKR